MTPFKQIFATVVVALSALCVLSACDRTPDPSTPEGKQHLADLQELNSGKSPERLLKCSNSQLLDSLDRYVSNSAQFEQIARSAINRNKQRLAEASTTDKLMLYEQIGTAYLHINVDSAMYYLGKGSQLANNSQRPREAMRMYLYWLQAAPLKVIIHESIANYQAIDISKLDRKDLPLYYETGRQVYNFAADAFDVDSIKAPLQARLEQCTDSLVKNLDPSSRTYRYYLASNALLSADSKVFLEGRRMAESLLAELTVDSPDFALISANLGQHYLSHNDLDKAKRYLALSAISDVMIGNGETTSLHRLGKLLYADNDSERAYRYLTLSLQRSVSTGARIRTIEVAEALPLVIATSNARGDSNDTLMRIIVVILTCLLLTMAVLFAHVIRHRQRLMKLRERLAERHSQLDDYIRELLSLCAGYIDAMENQNLLTARKIKAGQVSDLLNVAESGRALREPQVKFFKVFDRDFLNLFPDFVKDVNDLLLPDRRLAVPDDNTLTPELRILAFMRLGVDDSSQISRFLGLSLNTVYTYRNKLKNRAINRDTFDTDIRHIGEIV